MPRKIGESQLIQIREARLGGMKYAEIEKRFGVSRWTTVNYLKGTGPSRSSASAEMERLAKELLEKSGFRVSLAFRDVSARSQYDLLAEMRGEKWLIDIKLGGGRVQMANFKPMKGYRCAILLIDPETGKGRLVELREREMAKGGSGLEGAGT